MLKTAPLKSLLVQPERHPLFPAKTAATLGLTVAIAPHPDDESLGCGGLLALLAETGSPHVIVMTDGSRSHPNSPSYSAARLAALREEETLAALAALGLPPSAAHFLRYRDCGLPAPETPALSHAATRIHATIAELAPDTLLVPWRRDPHGDHEATWRLLRAAAAIGWGRRPRWLEYPVWAWTQAETDAAPRPEEGRAWRLDISAVLARKQQAIARHRSQMGAVIPDDPGGFVLGPEMLAHFARPWELFIEPSDG